MIENRETFFKRLETGLSPSELVKVRGAYMIAKYGHRWQKRKECGDDGLPMRYFEHLRRVALFLIDGLDCWDPDMICAALLHDSLEDTEEIDEALIEHFFGVEVARMVRLLSKKPKEGYHERLAACRDWRVLAIKLCGDRFDNVHALGQTEPAFQRRQIKETREIYLPLIPRLLQLAPKAYHESIQHMMEALEALVISNELRFMREDVVRP